MTCGTICTELGVATCTSISLSITMIKHPAAQNHVISENLTFALTRFRWRIHVLNLVITFEVLYEQFSKNDLLYKLNNQGFDHCSHGFKKANPRRHFWEWCQQETRKPGPQSRKEQMACLKRTVQMSWKQTSEIMKTMLICNDCLVDGIVTRNIRLALLLFLLRTWPVLELNWF